MYAVRIMHSPYHAIKPMETHDMRPFALCVTCSVDKATGCRRRRDEHVILSVIRLVVILN